MLQDYSKFVELKRVPVIDVPITGTNMSECVEFLTRHIDELHGEYICVSNAHTSVMAHDDLPIGPAKLTPSCPFPTASLYLSSDVKQ